MTRYLALLMPVLVLAFAVPVFAGDYECTATTQECLDAMATKMQQKGWVGVELDNAEGQLVISKVVAESPAEEAGMKVGDVFFAVNGVAYDDENKEEMEALRAEMKPGKDFTFTLIRKEKKVDVDVTLGNLPDDVLASWIGRHMLDHANVENAEE